jgi:hypothetical protein
MNPLKLLSVPAYTLQGLSYQEYATLLNDVIVCRQQLSSVQKRENYPSTYANREELIEKLDALKKVLSYHVHYDRYCEQLMVRVKAPIHTIEPITA